MTRLASIAALLVFSLLSGCATVARVDAAGDVHAFLISVRDDDRVAFDRLVDRHALKAQLETRILQATRNPDASRGVKLLTAVLAKPAADLVGDALIQPRVFRAGAEYLGYSPTTPIPNRLELAAALVYRPDGRVCATARKNGQCLFVFTQEGGTWKLTGFEGNVIELKGELR